MKYRLVVGYRASYHMWSVKILFPMSEDWNARDWEDGSLLAMIEWCASTGLGQRMAYDEFMFESEANATIFVLKFS